MPTNDQDLSLEEAKEVSSKLEDMFLSILNSDDEEGEEESGPELSEEQRATLQKVLEAELPSPEEIMERAKIAEYNAEIQRKREEKLARRKGRNKHRSR